MLRNLLTTLLILTALTLAAALPDSETLRYTVTFKWGLITKDAGEATVTLKRRSDIFDIRMTARTLPWADRIYRMRDTLTCVVRAEGFRPLSYAKAAHEDGRYDLDEISYRYTESGRVIGDVQRTRVRKNGERTLRERTLEGEGPTYDFLSVFYYLRLIDFSRLRQNQVVKVTVFSGSEAETLTIKSYGTEEVKMRNGERRRATRITFRFTRKGGKQSSEDITAWLSDDAQRIPLLLEGKLPVGKIRVMYDP